jgi:hypothetical protein
MLIAQVALAVLGKSMLQGNRPQQAAYLIDPQQIQLAHQLLARLSHVRKVLDREWAWGLWRAARSGAPELAANGSLLIVLQGRSPRNR